MDFLDCKICQVPYDEDDHRPRHAPCGHDLCSACVKTVIKEGLFEWGLFECPKCRQKSKIDVPDDFSINFGLIDVIRAFKTNPILSGVTNDEMCKLHYKGIRYWCLTCQIWTCEDCHASSHSSLIGCSVISSTAAMDSLKKKHNEAADKQLIKFEKDVNCVANKIQVHNNEKKRLIDKAGSHYKEIKKLKTLLDEGNTLKEELKESKKDLNAVDLPLTLIQSIL